MGIVGSSIRFLTGKTEEDDDDDGDDKEERESRPYRNHLYRTLPGAPGHNVYRTACSCKSPSNFFSSPGNDLIRKPPLKSTPAPAPDSSPHNDPQPRLPYAYKNAPVFAEEIFAPVKASPLNDPRPPLSHKNAPVFAKETLASPLNDPRPSLSHKNAVITSSQAIIGHPDRATVSIPKVTPSLAYTSADKARLPKRGSGKSEPKKGTEEVKKEVVVTKKKRAVHHDQGRWIKHYCSRHRILIVGEGDFSFSTCLATAFGCAFNMIVTSLDSEEFLRKNYNKAESNLNELKRRQCIVLHDIDATKMTAHEQIGCIKFDRIIFNFPFAGLFKTLSRDKQLRRHRRLVSRFLKNAKEMVSENGEIHISHKTNSFHVEWNLEGMASSHRLRLIEAVNFSLEDYPGYNTKRGFGGNKNFDCNPSKTYKFGIKWVPS